MAPLPNTIDEVLETLDDIIAETKSENNYLGIFAYVYRRTTAEIKKAILEKQFKDNEAMERFDVSFANLYIEAYWDFKAGKNTSDAWELSFHARNEKLIIMQHLILGMNAHINLDLGVAAGKFVPKGEIASIKDDFMKVNDILKALTNEMQEKIKRVSWWMFLLDWIGKDKDEILAGFSIKKARDFAWNVALKINDSNSNDEQTTHIQEVDQWVTKIGKLVLNPPGKIIHWVLGFVKRFEEKDVGLIIDKLEK